MDNNFLLQLESLLGLEKNTLSVAIRLKDLTAWDSMAVIEFIAWADETLGIAVDVDKLEEVEVVGDLLALLQKD